MEMRVADESAPTPLSGGLAADRRLGRCDALRRSEGRASRFERAHDRPYALPALAKTE
jgi:hypothetical protein